MKSQNVNRSDQEQGFYKKFDVYRLHDSTGKHDNCQYFVIDLMHDKYAVPALRAYAAACYEEFPELAADLWVKVGKP